MTATERLREMLDERGVEWMDDSYAQLWCTVWDGYDGKQWRMTENYSGMLTELKAWHVTPEQAIAATLWNEREKQLKNLLRDACWLITRAEWPTESVDEAAADWYMHIHAMGIEVD